jgi:hypothetical protein
MVVGRFYKGLVIKHETKRFWFGVPMYGFGGGGARLRIPHPWDERRQIVC